MTLATTLGPSLPAAQHPISLVKRASAHVDTYITSLVDDHVQEEGGPEVGGDWSFSREDLWKEIKACEDKLRATLLTIEILETSLRRARALYVKTRERRNQVKEKLLAIESSTKPFATLPPEVISHICSFWRGPSNTFLPHADFQLRSLRTWSSHLLKTSKVLFTPETLKTGPGRALIRKCPKPHFDFRDWNSGHGREDDQELKNALTTSSRWHGLALTVQDGKTGPRRAIDVLRKCSSALPTVVELTFKGGDDHSTFGPTTIHKRLGRSLELRAPKCLRADLEPVHLPLFGRMLPNLQHLVLHLLSRHQSECPTMDAYFCHLDLHALEFLEIKGHHHLPKEKLEARFFGGSLSLPNLKELAVAVVQLDGADVSAILRGIDCPKLESLVLGDVFVLPVGFHDDMLYELKPLLNDVTRMLQTLDDRCPALLRLSFYTNFPVKSSLWSSPASGTVPTIQSHWHQYLATIYTVLSSPSRSDTTKPHLPNLRYLTLPIDEHKSGADCLVEFVLTRMERWSCPLNTMEISFGEHGGDRLVTDRLGLYVRNVFSSTATIHDLY